MEVLMIGDVVGTVGCEHLRRVLPAAKRQFQIDVCVVNGENAADGNGLTPVAARHILDSGADIITGGNHTSAAPSLRKRWNAAIRCCAPPTTPPAPSAPGLPRWIKGAFRSLSST